jgi:hypothetical protein
MKRLPIILFVLLLYLHAVEAQSSGFSSEITSIKVFDTSQSTWRDYGDIFVIPTEDIQVLIEIKNTGAAQENWYVGVEFAKSVLNSSTGEQFSSSIWETNSASVRAWYDKGSHGSIPEAGCSLISDPNNNGIFDAEEIIKVKCWAPASYWDVVDIDKGEGIYIWVFETDKDYDKDGDGNKEEWWDDGIAKAAPPDKRLQDFEGPYPPYRWSGGERVNIGYLSDYSAHVWKRWQWSYSREEYYIKSNSPVTTTVNFKENQKISFYWKAEIIKYRGGWGKGFKFVFYVDGVEKCSKSFGDWSKCEVIIPAGKHNLKWAINPSSNLGGMKGYLDKVEISPADVDYTPLSFKVYTLTKGRTKCKYEYKRTYYDSWGNYDEEEKTEYYPTDLEGVDCGNSFFFKVDTFRYYNSKIGLQFDQQTIQKWYGPEGYKAHALEGEEVISSAAFFYFTCHSDTLGYCGYTCEDPYSCTTSTIFPSDNAILSGLFGPSGTIYIPKKSGFYPRDYVEPSLIIIFPQDGDIFYDNTTIIHGTTTSTGGVPVTKVEVSVNGEPYEPANGTANWSKTIFLRPGNNTITVRATNEAKVKVTKTIRVYREARDMVLPNLTIFSPKNRTIFHISGPIEINGYASDDRKLARVEISVNYGPYEEANLTNGYWNKEIFLSYGVNGIKVRAVDGSGNVNQSYLKLMYYRPITTTPKIIFRPRYPYVGQPSDAAGAVTGVTTGIFNFTSNFSELVEAMDYQREILDGTYLLAGINVTYEEEVLYGEAEPITPPNYTTNDTMVWVFPEIENGETINILYNVSFVLSALEKGNISKARISYIDGVTSASVVREFPPLQVEALNVVSLSINTSRRVYSPYDTIELVGTVSNNGNQTLGNLTLSTLIDTPTGVRVSAQPVDIAVLPPSSSLSFSLPLNKSSLLAPGNYTVTCTLVGELNVTLTNATTSFEMAGVISAKMKLFTDRGVYRLGEIVDSYVKINNTSPNTPLEDSYVEFLLMKRNSTLSRWMVNVSAIAPGEVRYVHSYFTPRNGSGEYLLNAALKLRNGTVLVAASKSFRVINVPLLVIEESLSTYATRALKVVNANLTVRNTGEDTAVNTSLVALLPENFTALNYAGDYNSGTNAITWQFGDIAADGSAGVAYTFLTPFIYSFDPVNYTLRAKVFYLDYYGKAYVSSVEKTLLVKPIPLLKGEIITEGKAYSGHSIAVAVNITNLGYDDAVNITALLTVPEEFKVQEHTLENASFNASTGTVTWSLELPPKEGMFLNFSAEAQLIAEIRNATLNLNITYYDEDGYAYHNSSSANVTVIPILVLAWSGDASDEWFIDEAARDIAYVKKVNTTQELMHELRSSYYTVLWLLNMGYCEYSCTEEGELNSTEVEEIKAWLSERGSLIRELIFSDYTLKANPSLGDIAGFKYTGSLPMGKPYQPKNLTITDEHYLTSGYMGANLTTVGWLDKVEPEYTYRVLAYAQDMLPTKKIESYPALTLSYYNGSRVIFFAPDIALSSYEGYNASVWLNITKRALLWSLEACESVASLSATKELKPQGEGKAAKTRASIDISSTGSVLAENVTVTEAIPEAFVIDFTDGSTANHSITWNLGALEPRSSRTLEYVLLNPEVSETTTFMLRTLINYSTPEGSETIELVSNVTIEPKKGGGKK